MGYATTLGKKKEFSIKSAEEMLPVVAKNSVFIVADIETTGFGAYDDILEIGAVKIHPDTKKIVQSFSSYCRMKNHKKVPDKITELTGICTKDVADAPNIETVLSAFQRFVETTPIVFHNAAFDWRMLGTKYKLIGRQLSNEVICTMKLFKYLHPDAGASNLDYITKYYGTQIVGHHRAVVDCKWTAAAFCKMRAEVMDSGIQPLFDTEALATKPSQPAISLEELRKQCVLYRISGWKKGKQKRIYCTTNLADFFFDLNEHVWNVSRKKTSRDLDTDALAKFVLGHLGLGLTEFQSKYAPPA